MGKDVIIACDFDSAQKTFEFLDKFTGKKPFVKIGMELYYAEGPSIVKELKARGHKIFLDLKLHDIPNTVKKSMAVLSRLDVDMTNLHAGGTIKMMEAAIEGLTRPDGTCFACLFCGHIFSEAVSLCMSDSINSQRSRRGSVFYITQIPYLNCDSQ